MKKIISISICVVGIILLSNFTSVIGSNSTKSFAKESPLFDFRYQNAIDAKSQKIDTSNYIRKDTELTLNIPAIQSKNKFISQLVDSISGMSEKQFQDFLNIIISNAKNEGIIESKQIPELKKEFMTLKENPTLFKMLLMNAGSRDNEYDSYAYPTHDNSITQCRWIPGCVVINMAIFVIMTVFLFPLGILAALLWPVFEILILFYASIVYTTRLNTGDTCCPPK